MITSLINKRQEIMLHLLLLFLLVHGCQAKLYVFQENEHFEYIQTDILEIHSNFISKFGNDLTYFTNTDVINGGIFTNNTLPDYDIEGVNEIDKGCNNGNCVILDNNHLVHVFSGNLTTNKTVANDCTSVTIEETFFAVGCDDRVEIYSIESNNLYQTINRNDRNKYGEGFGKIARFNDQEMLFVVDDHDVFVFIIRHGYKFRLSLESYEYERNITSFFVSGTEVAVLTNDGEVHLIDINDEQTDTSLTPVYDVQYLNNTEDVVSSTVGDNIAIICYNSVTVSFDIDKNILDDFSGIACNDDDIMYLRNGTLTIITGNSLKRYGSDSVLDSNISMSSNVVDFDDNGNLWVSCLDNGFLNIQGFETLLNCKRVAICHDGLIGVIKTDNTVVGYNVGEVSEEFSYVSRIIGADMMDVACNNEKFIWSERLEEIVDKETSNWPFEPVTYQVTQVEEKVFAFSLNDMQLSNMIEIQNSQAEYFGGMLILSEDKLMVGSMADMFLYYRNSWELQTIIYSDNGINFDFNGNYMINKDVLLKMPNTLTPTKSPTSAPSVSPTNAPTESPTLPTPQPTFSPKTEPTRFTFDAEVTEYSSEELEFVSQDDIKIERMRFMYYADTFSIFERDENKISDTISIFDGITHVSFETNVGSSTSASNLYRLEFSLFKDGVNVFTRYLPLRYKQEITNCTDYDPEKREYDFIETAYSVTNKQEVKGCFGSINSIYKTMQYYETSSCIPGETDFSYSLKSEPLKSWSPLPSGINCYKRAVKEIPQDNDFGGVVEYAFMETVETDPNSPTQFDVVIGHESNNIFTDIKYKTDTRTFLRLKNLHEGPLGLSIGFVKEYVDGKFLQEVEDYTVVHGKELEKDLYCPGVGATYSEFNDMCRNDVKWEINENKRCAGKLIMESPDFFCQETCEYNTRCIAYSKDNSGCKYYSKLDDIIYDEDSTCYESGIGAVFFARKEPIVHVSNDLRIDQGKCEAGFGQVAVTDTFAGVKTCTIHSLSGGESTTSIPLISVITNELATVEFELSNVTDSVMIESADTLGEISDFSWEIVQEADGREIKLKEGIFKSDTNRYVLENFEYPAVNEDNYKYNIYSRPVFSFLCDDLHPAQSSVLVNDILYASSDEDLTILCETLDGYLESDNQVMFEKELDTKRIIWKYQFDALANHLNTDWKNFVEYETSKNSGHFTKENVEIILIFLQYIGVEIPCEPGGVYNPKTIASELVNYLKFPYYNPACDKDQTIMSDYNYKQKTYQTGMENAPCVSNAQCRFPNYVCIDSRCTSNSTLEAHCPAGTYVTSSEYYTLRPKQDSFVKCARENLLSNEVSSNFYSPYRYKDDIDFDTRQECDAFCDNEASEHSVSCEERDYRSGYCNVEITDDKDVPVIYPYWNMEYMGESGYYETRKVPGWWVGKHGNEQECSAFDSTDLSDLYLSIKPSVFGYPAGVSADEYRTTQRKIKKDYPYTYDRLTPHKLNNDYLENAPGLVTNKMFQTERRKSGRSFIYSTSTSNYKSFPSPMAFEGNDKINSLIDVLDLRCNLNDNGETVNKLQCIENEECQWDDANQKCRSSSSELEQVVCTFIVSPEQCFISGFCEWDEGSEVCYSKGLAEEERIEYDGDISTLAEKICSSLQSMQHCGSFANNVCYWDLVNKRCIAYEDSYWIRFPTEIQGSYNAMQTIPKSAKEMEELTSVRQCKWMLEENKNWRDPLTGEEGDPPPFDITSSTARNWGSVREDSIFREKCFPYFDTEFKDAPCFKDFNDKIVIPPQWYDRYYIFFSRVSSTNPGGGLWTFCFPKVLKHDKTYCELLGFKWLKNGKCDIGTDDNEYDDLFYPNYWIPETGRFSDQTAVYNYLSWDESFFSSVTPPKILPTFLGGSNFRPFPCTYYNSLSDCDVPGCLWIESTQQCIEKNSMMESNLFSMPGNVYDQESIVEHYRKNKDEVEFNWDFNNTVSHWFIENFVFPELELCDDYGYEKCSVDPKCYWDIGVNECKTSICAAAFYMIPHTRLKDLGALNDGPLEGGIASQACQRIEGCELHSVTHTCMPEEFDGFEFRVESKHFCDTMYGEYDVCDFLAYGKDYGCALIEGACVPRYVSLSSVDNMADLDYLLFHFLENTEERSGLLTEYFENIADPFFNYTAPFINFQLFTLEDVVYNDIESAINVDDIAVLFEDTFLNFTVRELEYRSISPEFDIKYIPEYTETGQVQLIPFDDIISELKWYNSEFSSFDHEFMKVAAHDFLLDLQRDARITQNVIMGNDEGDLDVIKMNIEFKKAQKRNVNKREALKHAYGILFESAYRDQLDDNDSPMQYLKEIIESPSSNIEYKFHEDADDTYIAFMSAIVTDDISSFLQEIYEEAKELREDNKMVGLQIAIEFATTFVRDVAIAIGIDFIVYGKIDLKHTLPEPLLLAGNKFHKWSKSKMQKVLDATELDEQLISAKDKLFKKISDYMDENGYTDMFGKKPKWLKNEFNIPFGILPLIDKMQNNELKKFVKLVPDDGTDGDIRTNSRVKETQQRIDKSPAALDKYTKKAVDKWKQNIKRRNSKKLVPPSLPDLPPIPIVPPLQYPTSSHTKCGKKCGTVVKAPPSLTPPKLPTLEDYYPVTDPNKPKIVTQSAGPKAPSNIPKPPKLEFPPGFNDVQTPNLKSPKPPNPLNPPPLAFPPPPPLKPPPLVFPKGTVRLKVGTIELPEGSQVADTIGISQTNDGGVKVWAARRNENPNGLVTTNDIKPESIGQVRPPPDLKPPPLDFNGQPKMENPLVEDPNYKPPRKKQVSPNQPLQYVKSTDLETDFQKRTKKFKNNLENRRKLGRRKSESDIGTTVLKDERLKQAKPSKNPADVPDRKPSQMKVEIPDNTEFIEKKRIVTVENEYNIKQVHQYNNGASGIRNLQSNEVAFGSGFKYDKGSSIRVKLSLDFKNTKERNAYYSKRKQNAAQVMKQRKVAFNELITDYNDCVGGSKTKFTSTKKQFCSELIKAVNSPDFNDPKVQESILKSDKEFFTKVRETRVIDGKRVTTQFYKFNNKINDGDVSVTFDSESRAKVRVTTQKEIVDRIKVEKKIKIVKKKSSATLVEYDKILKRAQSAPNFKNLEPKQKTTTVQTELDKHGPPKKTPGKPGKAGKGMMMDLFVDMTVGQATDKLTSKVPPKRPGTGVSSDITDLVIEEVITKALEEGVPKIAQKLPVWKYVGKATKTFKALKIVGKVISKVMAKLSVVLLIIEVVMFLVAIFDARDAAKEFPSGCNYLDEVNAGDVITWIRIGLIGKGDLLYSTKVCNEQASLAIFDSDNSLALRDKRYQHRGCVHDYSYANLEDQFSLPGRGMNIECQTSNDCQTISSTGMCLFNRCVFPVLYLGLLSCDDGSKIGLTREIVDKPINKVNLNKKYELDGIFPNTFETNPIKFIDEDPFSNAAELMTYCGEDSNYFEYKYDDAGQGPRIITCFKECKSWTTNTRANTEIWMKKTMKHETMTTCSNSDNCDIDEICVKGGVCYGPIECNEHRDCFGAWLPDGKLPVCDVCNKKCLDVSGSIDCDNANDCGDIVAETYENACPTPMPTNSPTLSPVPQTPQPTTTEAPTISPTLSPTQSPTLSFCTESSNQSPVNVRLEQKIYPNDRVATQRFGSKVKVIGTTFFAGSEGGNAVYIFEALPTQEGDPAWTQMKKIKKPGIGFGSTFHAIKDDLIAINAPRFGSRNTGAIYLYKKSGNDWVEIQEIENPELESNTMFGTSIISFGNTTLVSATNAPITVGLAKRKNAGKVYCFTLNIDNTLSFDSVLTSAMPDQNNYFGRNIEFINDQIFISEEAAVEVYDTNLTFQQRIIANNDGEGFGLSMDANNQYLAIGAPFGTVTFCHAPFIKSGIVYIYEKINSNWQFVQYLFTGNREEDDRFGNNVIMTSDRLLVSSSGAKFKSGLVLAYRISNPNTYECCTGLNTPVGCGCCTDGYVPVDYDENGACDTRPDGWCSTQEGEDNFACDLIPDRRLLSNSLFIEEAVLTAPDSNFAELGSSMDSDQDTLAISGDADGGSGAVYLYPLNDFSLTYSPTVSPTVSPTLSPTTSPTISPTLSPTMSTPFSGDACNFTRAVSVQCSGNITEIQSFPEDCEYKCRHDKDCVAYTHGTFFGVEECRFMNTYDGTFYDIQSECVTKSIPCIPTPSPTSQPTTPVPTTLAPTNSPTGPPPDCVYDIYWNMTTTFDEEITRELVENSTECIDICNIDTACGGFLFDDSICTFFHVSTISNSSNTTDLYIKQHNKTGCELEDIPSDAPTISPTPAPTNTQEPTSSPFTFAPTPPTSSPTSSPTIERFCEYTIKEENSECRGSRVGSNYLAENDVVVECMEECTNREGCIYFTYISYVNDPDLCQFYSTYTGIDSYYAADCYEQVSCNGITRAPSPSPTTSPTPSVTYAPTTPEPSVSPTNSPTPAPTFRCYTGYYQGLILGGDLTSVETIEDTCDSLCQFNCQGVETRNTTIINGTEYNECAVFNTVNAVEENTTIGNLAYFAYEACIYPTPSPTPKPTEAPTSDTPCNYFSGRLINITDIERNVQIRNFTYVYDATILEYYNGADNICKYNCDKDSDCIGFYFNITNYESLGRYIGGVYVGEREGQVTCVLYEDVEEFVFEDFERLYESYVPKVQIGCTYSGETPSPTMAPSKPCHYEESNAWYTQDDLSGTILHNVFPNVSSVDSDTSDYCKQLCDDSEDCYGFKYEVTSSRYNGIAWETIWACQFYENMNVILMSEAKATYGFTDTQDDILFRKTANLWYDQTCYFEFVVVPTPAPSGPCSYSTINDGIAVPHPDDTDSNPEFIVPEYGDHIVFTSNITNYVNITTCQDICNKYQECYSFIHEEQFEYCRFFRDVTQYVNKPIFNRRRLQGSNTIVEQHIVGTQLAALMHQITNADTTQDPLLSDQRRTAYMHNYDYDPSTVDGNCHPVTNTDPDYRLIYSTSTLDLGLINHWGGDYGNVNYCQLFGNPAYVCCGIKNYGLMPVYQNVNDNDEFTYFGLVYPTWFGFEYDNTDAYPSLVNSPFEGNPPPEFPITQAPTPPTNNPTASPTIPGEPTMAPTPPTNEPTTTPTKSPTPPTPEPTFAPTTRPTPSPTFENILFMTYLEKDVTNCDFIPQTLAPSVSPTNSPTETPRCQYDILENTTISGVNFIPFINPAGSSLRTLKDCEIECDLYIDCTGFYLQTNQSCIFFIESGIVTEMEDSIVHKKADTSCVITHPTMAPVTQVPSSSPTKAPTKSPTTSPTKSPTVSPTLSPTEYPTRSPFDPNETASPSASPSTSPTTENHTLAPSLNTTDNPTNSPTDNPTNSPTDNPTNSPTDNPTNSPSSSPSNSPTTSPTTPTTEPTMSPTNPPTNSTNGYSLLVVHRNKQTITDPLVLGLLMYFSALMGAIVQVLLQQTGRFTRVREIMNRN